jgi:hypothetical protein
MFSYFQENPYSVVKRIPTKDPTEYVSPSTFINNKKPPGFFDTNKNNHNNQNNEFNRIQKHSVIITDINLKNN